MKKYLPFIIAGLLILIANPAYAAIALIGGNSKGDVTPYTISGWNPSTLPSGTFIVLQCNQGTSGTTYQVSDALGDSFTEASGTHSDGSATWWTITNSSIGAFSYSVNVTSTAAFTYCQDSGYSGVATTSPVVANYFSSGTNVTGTTGPIVIASGDLAVASAWSAFGVSSGTWAIAVGNNGGGSTQFYDIATTSPITLSYNNGGSEPWGVQTIVLQPPGSGGNPIQQFFNWILTFDW